ncbi:hypothetical protein JDW19_21475 [Paenibacillus polymyxa]|uniref:Uncharacterized protein n=1 Tax=Paenibacillus polymyxa TaxID=1406 RepID=A0A8I1LXA6_PAEPO|nr:MULTISPECIES: hypothetical protein [Paenibacillus]KAF6569860.1 hypothetical protein G9G53_21500 [Paenibacillus sp. EKM206P]KAF6585420.1 hypothetical protein G9G52_22750 [Paenibacillus sp. EKM205P]MBM0635682.1 hypothetical protein [Paenibacillus polymyxa]
MNPNDNRHENTQNKEDKKSQNQDQDRGHTIINTDKILEISKKGSRKYRRTLDKLSNT